KTPRAPKVNQNSNYNENESRLEFAPRTLPSNIPNSMNRLLTHKYEGVKINSYSQGRTDALQCVSSAGYLHMTIFYRGTN
ncbi:MAG: hypothetical protein AAFR36_25680, partial [Bacteroidota bacterium]